MKAFLYQIDDSFSSGSALVVFAETREEADGLAAAADPDNYVDFSVVEVDVAKGSVIKSSCYYNPELEVLTVAPASRSNILSLQNDEIEYRLESCRQQIADNQKVIVKYTRWQKLDKADAVRAEVQELMKQIDELLAEQIRIQSDPDYPVDDYLDESSSSTSSSSISDVDDQGDECDERRD